MQGCGEYLDVGWGNGVGDGESADGGVLVEFVGVDVDAFGRCLQGDRFAWVGGFFEGGTW